MRRAILVTGLILGSFVLVNAQRGRNPAPAPPPGDPPLINSERQTNINERSKDLRMTEKFPVHTTVNSHVFRENIRPLYRNSKKEERELLAPDAADAEKYAAFLNQKNTGLIKLVADQGCDEKFNVIVSSPHCQKYTMPGAGSTYSFREDDYRMRSLGDIFFTGDILQNMGKLVNGIFVDIGDVPLEQVGPETGGVKYLANIEPASDLDAINSFNEKLAEGIEDGEFTYRSFVRFAENRTYALRSIAYRGNIYRTVQGMTYDEMEFDKRRDLTIAFRVVRINPEEKTLTILWKTLAEQKSPKIDTRDTSDQH
ncbi:MAG: hypothetical protein R2747_23475 [Pyrinomonadaceae bacterium]